MASPANVVAMVARNNTPGRTTNSQPSDSQAFLSSLSQTLSIPTSIVFTGVTSMTQSGLMTDSRPPPAIPSPPPSADTQSNGSGSGSGQVTVVTHTETAPGGSPVVLTKTVPYINTAPSPTAATHASSCSHTCPASETATLSDGGGDRGHGNGFSDDKFKVYGAAIGVSLSICLMGCLLGWWFWYKRKLRRERGVRGGSIGSETTVGGMGMGRRMGMRQEDGEREGWWR
ncbi:hypothetical protein K491DRAFT_720970 [Lophiostoma macrostomum CBS 122681]|uniref:Mid2 domain-containing protein n=1 Tax=Lophiostoma macrostomum CBS 122681 TaxID=1314788 RepID=A0A6A6SQU3_9PLEO|nr:hypothetical protein K491DRAFT_720970 [Lophiostoma macrostomum CBS 122681]